MIIGGGKFLILEQSSDNQAKGEDPARLKAPAVEKGRSRDEERVQPLVAPVSVDSLDLRPVRANSTRPTGLLVSGGPTSSSTRRLGLPSGGAGYRQGGVGVASPVVGAASVLAQPIRLGYDPHPEGCWLLVPAWLRKRLFLGNGCGEHHQALQPDEDPPAT